MTVSYLAEEAIETVPTKQVTKEPMNREKTQNAMVEIAGNEI